MKFIHYSFIFLFSICAIQCKKEATNTITSQEKQTVTISGYFERIGDGTKVTLSDYSNRSQKEIATAYVKNKAFTIEVPKKDQVVVYTISVLGFEGFVPVISSQKDITLRMDINNLFLTDVSGDDANSGFSEYKKKKYQFDNQITSIKEIMSGSGVTDENILKQMELREVEFRKNMLITYKGMVEKNKTNFAAGLILEDLMRDEMIDFNEALNLFNSLSPSYTNSDGGKTTHQFLMRMAKRDNQ